MVMDSWKYTIILPLQTSHIILSPNRILCLKHRTENHSKNFILSNFYTKSWLVDVTQGGKILYFPIWPINSEILRKVYISSTVSSFKFLEPMATRQFCLFLVSNFLLTIQTFDKKKVTASLLLHRLISWGTWDLVSWFWSCEYRYNFNFIAMFNIICNTQFAPFEIINRWEMLATFSSLFFLFVM